jgi:cytoplasmic FMR1 interacting protein
LAQRLNVNIRENIHYALQKFESGNISTIMELDNMLDNIKLIHLMLSKYILVDSWDSIMKEVNESISLVSFSGRIATHVREELIIDLFPNFIYNTFTQRFVNQGEDENVERDKPPKGVAPYYQYGILYQLIKLGTKGFNNSYNNMNEQYRLFFGNEHLNVILKLVGVDSLAIIIETCTSFIEQSIDADLGPFMQPLQQAIQATKLHSSNYGLLGIYTYFTAIFRDFINYVELKKSVCQAFRSLGNCICFILQLDGCYALRVYQQTVFASTFLGIRSLTTEESENRLKAKNNTNEENDYYDIEDKVYSQKDSYQETPLYKAYSDLTKIEGFEFNSKSVLDESDSLIKKIHEIYNPKKEKNSFFKKFLERIRGFLENVSSDWKGGHEKDRIEKLDTSQEFFRIWAIINFVNLQFKIIDILYGGQKSQKDRHGDLWPWNVMGRDNIGVLVWTIFEI